LAPRKKNPQGSVLTSINDSDLFSQLNKDYKDFDEENFLIDGD
jgi:hypothetical protein